MDYQVTTQPLHEPVSLDQVRRHLRVDDTDSDERIRAYLAAARFRLEEWAGLAFLWQTVAAKCDAFTEPIRLPRAPLIAVSTVQYVDLDGTTQTLTDTVYDVDVTSEPGEIRLAYDQSWPSIRSVHHAVTITYIAGHARAFTAAADTDLLTVAGHLFRVGDFVRVYNIGGALPAGLAAARDYYVVEPAGATIKLATTEGGAAVDITGAGTGTHYIDALPPNYVSAILLETTDLFAHRGDEERTSGPSRAVQDLMVGRMVRV